MKTIRNILGNNHSSLGKLLAKCQIANDLARLFATIVDGSFAKHCKLASYQNGELTLVVTNAAWATKIRYAIPELIKILCVQPEFRDLKKINYNIDRVKMESQIRRTTKKMERSSANQIGWQAALEQLKKNHPAKPT